MSLQWGISTHQKRGLWLIAGLVGTAVGSALLRLLSTEPFEMRDLLLGIVWSLDFWWGSS